MFKKSKLEQAKASARLLIEKLLSEAKAEIVSAEQVLAKADETANQHYRAAADLIADAQKQNASQRKIAKDVGKSAAWVNQLLRWGKEGYLDSPFGTQSRAARARMKERSGATEHDQKEPTSVEKADGEGERGKTNKDKIAEAKAEARNAKAEAEKARAEAKKAEADAAKARANAERWKTRAKTQTSPSRDAIAANVERDDRERLVKLLGLMGSDHDGECLNAARKAEKLRKKLGLTWDDLIVPAQLQHAQAA